MTPAAQRWLLAAVLVCILGAVAMQVARRRQVPGAIVSVEADAPRPATPAPAGGPEVRRDALAVRAGRYYRPDDSLPFNGVVTASYPGGQRQYRCAVSNGLLAGLSEGWYSNGQKQVEEPFREGVSHGVRVKWYENGQKQSEVNIVTGKLAGVFRRWYDNGVLAEEVHMRDGNPDGVARSFYPSGRLKTEARLKDGKLVDRKSWADGEGPERASSSATSLPGKIP